MNTPPTLQSQPISRSGRKAKRDEGEELSKKPKKANSEIRKQQNRIASRNYREKRKRKLQYLQQLIRDESNDDETSEASPPQHETQLRALSVDFESSRPSSSPFLTPSGPEIPDPRSSGLSMPDTVSTTATVSFDSRYIPTSQSYSFIDPSWNHPSFNPPPPPNMAFHSPDWIPSMNYSARMVSRPEHDHYAAPAGPPVFAPVSSSYGPPQEMAMSADQFRLALPYEQYYGPQSQTPGISNVSLPTSTSYFQDQYPGPH